MQLKISSESRGHADHGWLKSKHSFSFADYYHPSRMGFSVLRVINEDWIAPHTGFPTHPHRDMEIITVVLEGAVSHQDTMGNKTKVLAGEVQRMSAGTGIKHSEFNHESEVLHLLQIWLMPSTAGIQPSYEQKTFDGKEAWTLLIEPDGQAGALKINQDARIEMASFSGVQSRELNPERSYWIQMIQGELKVKDEVLKAGDALAIQDESVLNFDAKQKSQFLFFDLP